MQISISQSKDLIDKVLAKYNYSNKEIEYISEVIMYGVLKNSSQGFPKLFGWRIEKHEDAKSPVLESTSQNTLRINGNKHNSMFVCNSNLDEIIKITKENSTCVTGFYNTDNSSGSLGFYTRKLAKAGLIGIMFASADPIGGIASNGSKSGIFGSNPLAISFPYKDSDVTLDMSTAAYTWGELIDRNVKNEKLEDNLAFDKDGNPTTDPSKAMKGFVNSFDGGFKGLGLAFMIQLLASTLSGSKYEQNDTEYEYGNLIITIDPEKFAGQEFINNEIEKIIETYKSNSNSTLFYPGERSSKQIQESLDSNSVEISDDLYKRIQEFIEK